MAAVIAQLNFRNRARKKQLKENKTYSTSKCMYRLEPFDATFAPAVHNKYMAARVKKVDDLFEAEVDKEMKKMMKKRINISSWPTFTWSRFLIEALIIGIINEYLSREKVNFD